MRRLSLTTNISILLTTVTILVVVIVGILFSLVSFYLIEKDFRSYLIDQTNDLVINHLTIEDGQIFFRLGPKGETITQRLRLRDLSAVIFGKNNEVLSTFGVFRTLTDKNVFNQILPPQDIQTTMTTLKPKVTHVTLPDGSLYELYATPVTASGSAIGAVAVARQEQFLSRIIKLNLLTLMTILPISALLLWIGSYFLTKRALRPLLTLIAHIHTLTVDNEPKPLEVIDSARDEISLLTNAYNTMLSRVGEGVVKQKQFIANASHELKTPMTRAVGSLDIANLEMEKGNMHKAQNRILEAKGAILDMGRMSDSLLTLSKLSDRTAPPSKHLNLNKLISQIIEKNSDLIKEKDIKVTLSVPEELTINISPEYGPILFSNLITNAIKYNTHGGLISFSVSQKLNSLEVHIADSGLGMDEVETAKIFERFFRSSHHQNKIKGFGLGLSIVKEISDLYGINIKVKSVKNQGTTFTLTQKT